MLNPPAASPLPGRVNFQGKKLAHKNVSVYPHEPRSVCTVAPSSQEQKLERLLKIAASDRLEASSAANGLISCGADGANSARKQTPSAAARLRRKSARTDLSLRPQGVKDGEYVFLNDESCGQSRECDPKKRLILTDGPAEFQKGYGGSPTLTDINI
uniref:Uncharacterized protein n=1 Tax=Steinernema glaseri TaxID=37863 RepID=A0A1I8ARB3_9BILA